MLSKTMVPYSSSGGEIESIKFDSDGSMYANIAVKDETGYTSGMKVAKIKTVKDEHLAPPLEAPLYSNDDNMNA